MNKEEDTKVSLVTVCDIIKKEAWRLAIRPDQAQELIKAIKRKVAHPNDQKHKLSPKDKCFQKHKGEDGKCHGLYGGDRFTDYLSYHCIGCKHLDL